MNWRWLIMDYVDPQLGLSWQQRREVWWYIRTKSGRSNTNPRHHWRMYLFALVPGTVMMIVLLPVFLFNTSWSYLLILVPAQLIITWLALAFAGWWAHRPFVIEALRHYGHDVCIECGYDLHGISEETDRCPECGAKRAENISNDQLPHATGDLHEPAP